MCYRVAEISVCGLLRHELVETVKQQGDARLALLSRSLLSRLPGRQRLELLGLMAVRLQGGREDIPMKECTVCYLLYPSGELFVGLYSLPGQRVLNRFFLARLDPLPEAVRTCFTV